MKPWTKWASQPAIGLLIDEHEIGMSVTVATLRGRREVAHETRSYEEQPAEEALKNMLAPWIGPTGALRSGAKPWVHLGLSEARVFQAAVPITPANRQHTPQNFFLEAVQVTNVRAEDRIVELIKVELGRQELACVAASPRGNVESSVDMMTRLGTRVGLIESSPGRSLACRCLLQQGSAALEIVRSLVSGPGAGDGPPGCGRSGALLAYVRPARRR